MATTDLKVKGIRHRGLYEGREQSVSGRFRMKDGDSLATTDLIEAVPLGENVAPYRMQLTVTKLNGDPSVTGGAFDVGVAPIEASLGPDTKRPDGREYPPLEEDDDRLGSLDLDGGARVAADITVDPSDEAKWGPFYVTLTPSEAFSVAGGDIDVQLTVYFLGEKEEADPVYTSWLVNEGKYQND